MEWYCERHKKLATDWCDHCEYEKVKSDARNFGNGFYRRYPDGRVEHIPHEEIKIRVRANNRED